MADDSILRESNGQVLKVRTVEQQVESEAVHCVQWILRLSGLNLIDHI